MTNVGLTVEPTEPVSRSWAWRFNLAWVGMMVGLFGPIQVLLPNQAEAISPDHKEWVLGFVTALGATCALVFNPLWGALSDRCTSRFGRRLPFVVYGTLAGIGGLILLSTAEDVGRMVLAWCLVQTALAAPWAALTASVPDQVPVVNRGRVAGWLGLAQMIGVFVAIGLATIFPGRNGYLACAAVLIPAVLPFLLLRRDAVLAREDRDPWSWRAFGRSLWIDPRRYPDFGWAWFTRFLVNLGYTLVLVYLLYYLRDEVGRDNAEADLLLLSVVNAFGVMLAVVVSGVYSDRLGRRKPFVAASSVAIGGAAIIAMVPQFPVLILAAFVVGVGFGVYTAVDFALITQVLPEAAARGKDMGVLNIAAALPQVVAPAIAAPVVSLSGYPLLFALAAVAAVASGWLVRRIKNVD